MLKDMTDSQAKTGRELGKFVADGTLTPREFYEAMASTMKMGYNCDVTSCSEVFPTYTSGYGVLRQLRRGKGNVPRCVSKSSRARRAVNSRFESS